MKRVRHGAIRDIAGVGLVRQTRDGVQVYALPPRPSEPQGDGRRAVARPLRDLLTGRRSAACVAASCGFSNRLRHLT